MYARGFHIYLQPPSPQIERIPLSEEPGLRRSFLHAPPDGGQFLRGSEHLRHLQGGLRIGQCGGMHIHPVKGIIPPAVVPVAVGVHNDDRFVRQGFHLPAQVPQPQAGIHQQGFFPALHEPDAALKVDSLDEAHAFGNPRHGMCHTLTLSSCHGCFPPGRGSPWERPLPLPSSIPPGPAPAGRGYPGAPVLPCHPARCGSGA